MTSNVRSWATSTFISILLVALAGTASAQSQIRSFNVPVQSATTGIPEFARQAGIQILVDEKLVHGKQTAAVTGSLTVDRALTILLQGTGLKASSKDGVTFTLSALPSHAAREPAPDRALPGADGNVLASPPSSPEPQNPALEEIVVTGTNITGVENKTIPLMTFDRDAIDRSGYASIGDFITSLPQNVKSGPNSPDGILSGVSGAFNNIENSTAANLRGLGASSTLTLVNGHRLAASSLGTAVDLSMIPLSAVERIEVLTDGSSAVYGTDAVGGVVNIILRKDFNGQETTARLDTLSRGGGEVKQISQSAGRTWNSGGVLGVFQFDDSNAIRSDQRSFTNALPSPTDVFPATKRYSAVLSAHQSVGPSVDLFGDILLQHNTGRRSFTEGVPPAEQITDSSTNSTSANTGLRWQPFGDWHLELDALFSRVNTLTTEAFIPLEPPYVNGEPYVRAIDTIKEGDLKLDGTLWSSGGSSLKGAVGASYRQETFSLLEVFANLDNPSSRHVHAAFAELYAPLISAANAVPGTTKLELSAAIRSDSYSDFGAKTNPRFGVFWAPINQLTFRAAYSTSFRAPNPTELFDTKSANQVIIESGYPQPNDPAGNASVLFFGNSTLQPETSRNLTAGLEFSPTELSGTRFSLNYYRIVYSNRLIVPPINANLFLNPQIYGPLIKQFPNDAAVEAFVASLQPPQQIEDLSSGQTGLAGIRYGYSYGVVNATREKTEGLDLGAHSLFTLSSADRIALDFNATYIRQIETTFCETCATTDLVNTYGQPLKLRLRAGGGWSNGIVSANAAINFANSYSDTNLVPPGRVASFTTLDLNASWLIRATGTTLSLNILNALNSNPPHTAFPIEQINYDPNNADPRGRTLSLQIRQSW